MHTTKWIVTSLFAAAAFAQTAGPISVPATFRGVLPCADCSGIATVLTLRADGFYFLQQTYQGKGKPAWEAGQWNYKSDGKTLQLRGQYDDRFFAAEAKTLTALDREGNPIQSKANLTLKRMPNLVLPNTPLKWQGMFVYMADAAVFTQCRTAWKIPVQGGAEYLAMERAYSASGVKPGMPTGITFEGRLKPNPEKEGKREVLSVDRAAKLTKEINCNDLETMPGPVRTANTDLSGKWMLKEINGTPAQPGMPGKEAYLEFDTDKMRVAGSGGCNRIAGGYEMENGKMKFKQFASTMMACPNMGSEQQLLKIINEGTAEQQGDQLTVTSAAGRASYQRANATAGIDLSGKWMLKDVNGVAPQIATPGREPFLEFDTAKMRVAGLGGCNRISGSYTVDGQTIQFKPFISTRMACPDMQSETALLQALNNATVRVTGNTLEIVQDGQVVARYQK
jgi:copper homeostasis protein (lipoprotein)